MGLTKNKKNMKKSGVDDRDLNLYAPPKKITDQKILIT